MDGSTGSHTSGLETQVPQASMRVLQGTGVLHASARSGYVLTVIAPGAPVAAMANVPFRYLATRAHCADLAPLLKTFVAAIKDAFPPGVARVGGIYGGSPVPGLNPKGANFQLFLKQRSVIEEALLGAGVTATQTHSESRGACLVTVVVEMGLVDVEWVPLSSENILSSEAPQREPSPVEAGEEAPQREPSPVEAGEDAPPRIFMVDMGCMKVAASPTRLGALLGSCVGIALYDPTTRIGGLAHAMLPINKDDHALPARYADSAVVALVKAAEQAGASRARLQAKLAGGGRVLKALSEPDGDHIGLRNIQAAEKALGALQIPVLGRDLGDDYGRKVMVNLEDFRIQVRPLKPSGGRTP